MKAKIDRSGGLWLERAGKLKDQVCPFNIYDNDEWNYCGDWCALFGVQLDITYECSLPNKGKAHCDKGYKCNGCTDKTANIMSTVLSLCKKNYILSELIDERGK